MLGISRASYYRWKKKSLETQNRYQMEKAIRQLYVKHKFRYGYRKITAILRKEQVTHHKVVQRIMQNYRWQCRVKRKKRKQTGQPYFIAPNTLNREFTSEKPFEKLVTDMTYLPFGGKMLYLSSILDLYNNEIIAYTIEEKQDVSLVLDTLHQLPELPAGCLLHNDQGSVYMSTAY